MPAFKDTHRSKEDLIDQANKLFNRDISSDASDYHIDLFGTGIRKLPSGSEFFTKNSLAWNLANDNPMQDVGLPDALCNIIDSLITVSQDNYASKNRKPEREEWEDSFARSFPLAIVESIKEGMDGYIVLFAWREWLLTNKTSPLAASPPFEYVHFEDFARMFADTSVYDPRSENMASILRAMSYLHSIDNYGTRVMKNLLSYYNGDQGAIDIFSRKLVEICAAQ